MGEQLTSRVIELEKPASSYEEGIESLSEAVLPINSQLKNGMILVEMKAACVNYPDLMQMTNDYQHKREFPYIPGLEGSGVVLRSASNRFTPGDRVMFQTFAGTFVSCLTISAEECFKIPETLSFEEAAAFLIGFTTAYHSLIERAEADKMSKSSWILVSPGTGGMGLAACLLAKQMGFNVIATGGSDEKLDLVKKVADVDHVLNYNLVSDFSKEVKKLTPGNEGVDILWDSVGSNVFEQGLKCTKYGAKVLIVGFTGRKIPSIPANYILIKQLSVLGCRVNETIKRSENGDEILAKRMKSLLEMAANKNKSLKPFVSHVFEFNVKGVRQAFRCLLNRNVVGRVCVSSEIDSKL